MARLRLHEDDWAIIRFWDLVRDEYRHQGETKTEAILTPSLSGYVKALEVYGYPRDLWPWLVSGAMLLHRLINGQDVVQWKQETGKFRQEIGREDLTDANQS